MTQELPVASSSNNWAVPDRVQSLAAKLPIELVLAIYGHLSPQDIWNCTHVCRLWCHAGIDLLWYRPSIQKTSALLKLMTTLKSPNQTFPYGEFIKRLNLTALAAQLPDEVIDKFSVCTKLERLTLAGSKKVTDEGLKNILLNNRSIMALDIASMELITDKSVELIAETCRGLQGLNMTDCKNITDDAILILADSCPSLRRIKVSNCVKLGDTSVLKLTDKCKNLMEVDLNNCSTISDHAIDTIFRNLPSLREFRIAGCSNITDTAFESLTDGSSPSLRILDLTSCARITDDTIARIVNSAQKLRNLVLAKCPNISDRGCTYIARLGKNLHYLHLGHCSAITDRGAITIAQHCQRIRYLDLACCSQISDNSVQRLAQLPKLRRIGLVKCANVSDRSIEALINRQGENTLERVHMSYCVRLTLTAVLYLVNACNKLTHLSLTGVPSCMRDDLRQFCRPSPPDFNQHQQAVFCVFSGDGVKALRKHLNELYEFHRQQAETLYLQHQGENPEQLALMAAQGAQVMFDGGFHNVGNAGNVDNADNADDFGEADDNDNDMDEGED
ncbi:SCF ubiquitin ligase complex subunit [Saitoella coloradoensis]